MFVTFVGLVGTGDYPELAQPPQVEGFEPGARRARIDVH